MIPISQLLPFESDIVSNRRFLHQHPETGFEEIKSSSYIAEQLSNYGIETRTGIGKTGVIGILKGDQPGKTVALRADIDALDLRELVDCEFKSTIDRKMHACGHDAHTAMLLGAARYLCENRNRVKGCVKFVFQPAEEGPYPGGAVLMMESGLLDDVDAIFALHVDPSIQTGTTIIPVNAVMARADFFAIELIGKGGHGATPQDGVDPIYMSSQVISGFQGIISRMINPVDPCVISIGTIKGGSSYNILPESVQMTGTIRSMNDTTRQIILNKMEATLGGVSSMCGGTYKFELVEGYPPVYNDSDMATLARSICSNLFGSKNTIAAESPRMTAEDFSYYLEKIPGAFIWLGCGKPGEIEARRLHSPYFELDEKALVGGATILINLVDRFQLESN